MSLRKLLGLCEHKFKVINVQYRLRNVDSKPVATVLTQQCEHCGKLRTKVVK